MGLSQLPLLLLCLPSATYGFSLASPAVRSPVSSHRRSLPLADAGDSAVEEQIVTFTDNAFTQLKSMRDKQGLEEMHIRCALHPTPQCAHALRNVPDANPPSPAAGWVCARGDARACLTSWT